MEAQHRRHTENLNVYNISVGLCDMRKKVREKVKQASRFMK